MHDKKIVALSQNQGEPIPADDPENPEIKMVETNTSKNKSSEDSKNDQVEPEIIEENTPSQANGDSEKKSINESEVKETKIVSDVGEISSTKIDGSKTKEPHSKSAQDDQEVTSSEAVISIYPQLSQNKEN